MVVLSEGCGTWLADDGSKFTKVLSPWSNNRGFRASNRLKRYLMPFAHRLYHNFLASSQSPLFDHPIGCPRIS